MRIIVGDSGLIMLGLIGAIFSIAMIGLLWQLTSDIEEVRKSFDEMTCKQLQDFSKTAQRYTISDEEVRNFENAYAKCIEQP